MLTERQLLWLGEDIDVTSVAEKEKRVCVNVISNERMICYHSTKPVQYFQGSSFNRKKKVRAATVDSGGYFVFEKKKTKRKTDHSLSKKTKLKIKEKVMSFYSLKKSMGKEKEFCFLTLTFVAKVSDEVAIRLLNLFLNFLRKKTASRFEYIWIAERQSNRNIHFHLVFDRCFYKNGELSDHLYLDYINSYWVVLQEKFGIVNQIAKKKLLSRLKISKFSYIHNRGQYEVIKDYLNPVSVVKVYSLSGLSYYLTKYLTKGSDCFKCQAWHCSRLFSRIFTKQLVGSDVKKEVFDRNINKSKKGKVPVVCKNDFAICIKIYNKEYFSDKYLNTLDIINQYVCELQDNFLNKIEYLSFSFEDFFKFYTQKAGKGAGRCWV